MHILARISQFRCMGMSRRLAVTTTSPATLHFRTNNNTFPPGHPAAPCPFRCRATVRRHRTDHRCPFRRRRHRPIRQIGLHSRRPLTRRHLTACRPFPRHPPRHWTTGHCIQSLRDPTSTTHRLLLLLLFSTAGCPSQTCRVRATVPRFQRIWTEGRSVTVVTSALYLYVQLDCCCSKREENVWFGFSTQAILKIQGDHEKKSYFVPRTGFK